MELHSFSYFPQVDELIKRPTVPEAPAYNFPVLVLRKLQPALIPVFVFVGNDILSSRKYAKRIGCNSEIEQGIGNLIV